MYRKVSVVAVSLVCMILFAAVAVAQEGPPLPGEVVIADLGAPRGLAFDAAGNLWVADAGVGGDVEMIMPGPEGEGNVSLASQFSDHLDRIHDLSSNLIRVQSRHLRVGNSVCANREPCGRQLLDLSGG